MCLPHLLYTHVAAEKPRRSPHDTPPVSAAGGWGVLAVVCLVAGSITVAMTGGCDGDDRGDSDWTPPLSVPVPVPDPATDSPATGLPPVVLGPVIPMDTKSPRHFGIDPLSQAAMLDREMMWQQQQEIAHLRMHIAALERAVFGQVRVHRRRPPGDAPPVTHPADPSR